MAFLAVHTLGTMLRITICSVEQIEGELFSIDIGGYDRALDSIVLRQQHEHGTADYTWIKTAHIQEVIVKGPPASELLDLPSIDLKCVEARANQSEAAALEEFERHEIAGAEFVAHCRRSPIVVRTLEGIEHGTDLEICETQWALKSRVAALVGVSVARVQLCHGATLLRGDTIPIEDLGVQTGAEVTLVLDSCAGTYQEVNGDQENNGKAWLRLVLGDDGSACLTNWQDYGENYLEDEWVGSWEEVKSHNGAEDGTVRSPASPWRSVCMVTIQSGCSRRRMMEHRQESHMSLTSHRFLDIHSSLP